MGLANHQVKPAGEASEARQKWPVDAHVHFHRPGSVGQTLDRAAANFKREGTGQTALLGALLLAESSRERVFKELSHSGREGRWAIDEVAGEPEAMIATADVGRIAIVSGRQIRCESGLEVLALGSLADYPEGRPLRETLDRVRADGAITVLPWGFGKWTGRRGAVVRKVLEDYSPDSLFVGDNGGRLSSAGRPRMIDEASKAGFRVLPGSDPFPFGSDYRRVGGFGFLADMEPDAARPWGSLREWLEGGGTPVPYGRALGPFVFAFNQAWIQVYNRLPRKDHR